MGILETLDHALTDLFGQWNVYSTGLMTLIVLVISYRIFSSREPDIHPMLLARQATYSNVRHEGESAVFRSQAAPYGMPLNGGLNVRDPGMSKWTRGRRGDLRDIWRKAALGGEDGARGKIFTVLGVQKVIEHKSESITRQINLIGQHITDQGGSKVAIYLPNSIELLTALFACSFYTDLTPILIPYNVTPEELVSMLRRSSADTVIAASGAFPFDAVQKAYPALRNLVWVVDEGSSHMDWNEIPEGTGGSVNVSTWLDVVRDAPLDAGAELMPLDLENEPSDLVTFWMGKPGEMEEMVRFSQANVAAGVSGQIASIPVRERLNVSDMMLPADSLANAHTLMLTLAAIYQNASIALSSSAMEAPDLALATQGVAPTVIVARPETVLQTHAETKAQLGSALSKLSHYFSTRVLTEEGIFAPTAGMLSAFASRPAIGTAPGKLRLMYITERAGTGCPRVSAETLSDLRVFLGTRVVYALAAPRVAGGICQTSFFDYRVGGDHFGGPVVNVEYLMKDKDGHKTTDDVIEGEVVVRGPSVVGGETNTGIVAKIRDDYTLAYA